MEISNKEFLFVYGTLMSSYNGKCAAQLRKHARLLGTASASGELVMLSWYPGFINKESGKRIWGELYEVIDGSRLWPLIDEYEGVDQSSLVGEEYRREVVEVEFSGNTVAAWVYTYIGATKGEPIPSGRF